jgi:hypothetical protein
MSKPTQVPPSRLIRRKFLIAAGSGAAVLALGACGDDADDPKNADSGAGDDASTDAGTRDAATQDAGSQDGSPDSGTGETKKPLYLIAAAFLSADQYETYLVTSSTFEKSTKIDPTRGPKLLGGIVPVVVGGSVYAPDSNAPKILRFDVDENDELVKKAELSFAGVGLTQISSFSIYAVSETKAYVYDPTGPRLVLWNPSTMKLTGKEIKLPEVAKDGGWTPNLVLELCGPVARDKQLVVPVGWTDQDGNYLHATGVVILDTESDEVVSFDEDERGGEAYQSIVAPNGDIYYFSSGAAGAQHFFADKKVPTQVLRLRAGETKLDRDYAMDLSKLGTGSAGTGAIPDGATGFFFGSADEKLWEDRENNGEAFYRIWHYDFETEASHEVESMPDWAGTTYYVTVGGKVFIPYWEETDTGYRTTVYTVDGAKDPAPLFSFDASWYGFARIR